MNTTGPYWWWINIGPGNGLAPSGNKPLPDPMLTQFLVTGSGIGLVRRQAITWTNDATVYIVIQGINSRDMCLTITIFFK